ncbi:MAG: N-acetyltransferase [Candidatus Eremiobacteraeota bacterium]|nr:N-acetyltransferase [Candidatus Eremiobacteraeota bacterium]
MSEKLDLGHRVTFGNSVGALEAAEWDACAGTDNPFVSHAFLESLEKSGCVGEKTGWLPYPALLRERPDGPLLGAAPCYIKLHSKGEYMFDYHWADAYHRLQPEEDSYYPKLQVAVPFTPVPGPRILVDRGLPVDLQKVVKRNLLQSIREQADKLQFSSAHVTFCQEDEVQDAVASGDYLPRLGEQYHWFNDDYKTWDDFLVTLTSRKRKNIRKERERANSHPLEIVTLHGSEVTPEQLLRFYRMYQTTCMQKWGQPYLNLDFFQRLAQTLGDRLVLFLVRRTADGQWVAGAWNLRGDNALFGRNWGCLEQYDLLHFEVCYYRAIEYAIEHGLSRVEAGAQGMHKIGRGYRPRPVHSVHYIRPLAFRTAIAQYLASETQEMEFRLEALAELEPFKSSP